MVLAALTMGFDITILNVALPTLATDLGLGTSGLQWVVNAYVLVFAALILPMGAAGDRWGRRALLLAGLGLFAAASAAASWASSGSAVIAARAVMGVAAAMVMPMTLATLTVLFPVLADRAKAVSAVVAATGLGVALGPVMGGYLLERFWWGSIFLVNVPVALLAMAAIRAILPESRDPAPRPLDFTGASLAVLGLAGFTFAVIEAPLRGWTSARVLAVLIPGLALVAAFAWWERHTAAPMIDIHLFRQRAFVGGSLVAALAGVALFGLLFVIPQYLQLIGHHDPLATGVRLMPVIGGLVLGAAAAPRLAARWGHRAPAALGLLALTGGLSIGTATSVGSGYGFTASWLALSGIGIGASLASATDAVLNTLPPERSGTGIALAMTIRYVGGALGVAVLGAVLSQSYNSALDVSAIPAAAVSRARESVAGAIGVAEQLGRPELALAASSAFVHGMTLVLLVCAAVSLAGAFMAAALLSGLPARTERVQR